MKCALTFKHADRIRTMVMRCLPKWNVAPARYLQADRSVILDATHYQRRYRTYAIDLARQLRVPCVAVWFDTPLAEALRRNGWRTGDRFGEQRVPDHIIRDMAAHFDPPGNAEFDRVVKNYRDRVDQGSGNRCSTLLVTR